MNKDSRAEFKTKQFQDMLKEALGTTCVNCGSNEHIHYHHIVPLINGGTNNLGNIVPLCEDCHGLAHERSSYKLLREGKERAKAKGGYQEGRPKKYTEQELDKAIELLTIHSYKEVERMTGISKSTLIRYHNKLLREGKESAKTKEGYREGRPKEYSKQKLDEAIELLKTHSYKEVEKITKISKSTLIRYKKIK